MISFVQSNAHGGEVYTTLTGVTAGNLIIVGYTEVKDASPTTLSCSDGASTLTAVAESSGTFVRWRFFYLLSANSGNRTYTITGGNGSTSSTIVMEFSYTGSLSFEDYSNNSDDESTSVSSGNIQPSGYSLVLGGSYAYGGSQYSSCQVNGVAADGQKSHSDLNTWPPMWYRVVTAGFDGAATCTTSDPGYYTASAISFREQTITTTTVVDPDAGTGYDYDSLSDWEADLGGTTSGDLPADNEIAVAKCRCTGGTADGTAVSINGWATDATHYIKVWTDPAESYRHNGTYQTGNKYRIELSSIGTVLEVLEDYVKIYGIQIYNSSTGTGDNHPSVLRADTSAGAVIGFVIGRMNRNAGDYPHGIVSGGANSVVFNCVVYDVGTSSYGAGFEKWSTGSSGCLWYNNTAHNCHYGFRVPDDGCSSTTQIAAKNCLAQDCDDGFYSSWTWNTASTNNCSDISSDAPGSNPQTGEVLFADEDNNDFHLSASDTVAKGVGINLYNDISYPFQDDIDGDDRGSTRDSDDFTNTNGTLLNTHNSLWDAAASTDISEIEIQGNAVVSNTTWGGGYAIYNNGQPANQTSQAVFKATASPKPETRSVIVRASSTTEGYRLKFEDTSGDNYTSLKLNKNGTWEYTFSSSGTWSCLVDHTLRLEVTTIGSDAVLTAFVDGVQVGSAHTDSSSPIASGYPGFSIGADATASSYALDSWESAVAWDIGADEYIDSYQLPVNRQYIRGATATWYEVVDVYVLKDGVFVPDKIIKILDSGSWI